MSAMLLPAARAEWTKFRSARAMIWTTGVMAALWPALSLVVALTGSLPDDDTVLGGSLAGGVNAQVAAGVLGALCMTSEFRTGSIGPTLAAVPRRGRLLAAKAAVVSAVVLIVTIVMTPVAFGIGWLLLDRDVHPTGDPFPAIIGVGAVLVVTAVLGLALGAVLRHPAGSMVAIIGVLLLPSMVGPLFGDMERWIGSASPTGVLVKLRQSTEALHETTGSLGGWPSLGVVAAGTAGVLAGAIHRFSIRDV